MITIGGQPVGEGHPTYVIAECGINHSGDLDTALKLIDAAVEAGADACKFQKRSPRLDVPENQWDKQRDKQRDTPWGRMSYIEYKEKLEFGIEEYTVIDKYCYDHGIHWFASIWGVESLAWMEENFNPVAYKIPSAKLTDNKLLLATRDLKRPIILSTGMSTHSEIYHAMDTLTEHNKPAPPLAILHCTSTYPSVPEELNLNVIKELLHDYCGFTIGYSNHSPGIIYPAIAVSLGAQIIEAHICLDRSDWGTDQSSSIEPKGFAQMVHYIRCAEKALGDGVKKVFDSELPIRKKLRGE